MTTLRSRSVSWALATAALMALAPSPAFAQPSITANGVVNAAGYQTRLAPDTVFVVFGSGLGPTAIATGSAPDYPATLGGTSIALTPATPGPPTVSARMVYSLATQVAGLLPSSIAPGQYALRVTYNGQTSAPQTVTVVARSFGIATSNSAGTGLAQATIGNVNSGVSLTRFTGGSIAFGGLNWTLTPAHPGDTIVLWGTGGGADPANDTGGSSGDQTAAGNFSVDVDGHRITPQYAGASSGYPGLWQVNFTLPSDLPLDCFASVQVTAGGELSNRVTIPIAAAGAASCSDPNVSDAILKKLDSGGTLTFAAFAIAKLTETTAAVTQETASGAVSRFTAASWILLNSGPVFGACRIYDRTYPQGGLDPALPAALLDAGAKLPMTGPNLAAGFGLASLNNTFGVAYAASLTSGTLVNGTYKLSGPGGTQMGPFSASTVFPGSFTVTNWDSITLIDRKKPLTFNWTGSAFDQVAVVISTNVLSAGQRHIATLNCTLPGPPGTYTIPAEALAYLSPAAVTGTSFGGISLQAISVPGVFDADLVGGGKIDIGSFGSNLGVSKNISVQ